MRSFWIYLIGTLMAVAAVGYGLYAVGVGTTWVVIAVLLVGGIGIASGAGLSKKKSSESSESG
ncbi:hypothetical protein [Hyphobacterium sp.]|jgi:hypothetical protein|uniref:hypothetical protein n=1 Tax=Hyphobacterium sp. TaxID=2004662 RepID=UPI003BA9FD30